VASRLPYTTSSCPSAGSLRVATLPETRQVMAGPLPIRVLPSGEGVDGRGADDKGRTAALLVKKYRRATQGSSTFVAGLVPEQRAPGQGVNVTAGYKAVALTSQALSESGAPPTRSGQGSMLVRGASGTTEPHILVSTTVDPAGAPRFCSVAPAFPARCFWLPASGASPARAERGFGGGKPRAAPEVRAAQAMLRLRLRSLGSRRVGAATSAKPFFGRLDHFLRAFLLHALNHFRLMVHESPYFWLRQRLAPGTS
jgi:hypothetical protein